MRFARVKAFTLVELLVVVSIIALLLAILLPSLNKARSVAKAVVCSSNLKAVGSQWVLFANDNNDRGPGRAQNIDSQHSHSPLAWQDLINFHIKPETVKGYIADHRPIQRLFAPGGGRPIGLDSRAFGCPDMNLVPSVPTAARPWLANANMVGGPNWVAGQGDPDNPSVGGAGLYGARASNPGLPKANGWYVLGTMLSSVRTPSYTFTVFDSARSSDDDVYRSGVDPTAATEANPISSGSPVRFYAYRHPSLTGNYLFADGHVETLASIDPTLNISERFSVR